MIKNKPSGTKIVVLGGLGEVGKKYVLCNAWRRYRYY